MSAGASRSGTVAVLLPPFGIGGSLRRIRALVLRYMYLLRSSGIRLLELIYWPFLQMLTWGFLQKYLAGTTSPLAQAAGVLIGAVLLWDILFRSKIGFSTTFIEEMWSRNLGNLLTSPLRPFELVAALGVWSVLRLADRVILLDAGRILEDDAPSVLIEAYGRETLEEVFLDVVRGRAQRGDRDDAGQARKAS